MIERILNHIGEDPIPPRVLPARSPPQLEMPFAPTAGPVTWPEVDQTAEFGPGICPPTGTTWPYSAAAASASGAKPW